MIRQAIIPLAGLGTRLLPLTSVFAKELLPINGKPGLEYILDECIDAGIKEICPLWSAPIVGTKPIFALKLTSLFNLLMLLKIIIYGNSIN